MLATTRIVRYVLVGEDRVSPAMGRAGRSMSTFERTAARVGRTVTLFGEALGAAMIAGGVESVRMAASYQASMVKVQTQAGASTREMHRMSEAVLKLGKYAEQSPQTLADSLFHLESVGLRGAKALHALKIASDLSAVSGARLEDTTNALAGAWRSGIKGARSFGKTAATLNAIVGTGNMRMQDLVDAMSSGILPAARTFGVSLKSVGSALALMTDEGVPAQLAATRLRMTLSLMGAPSSKAVKALGSIGLSSTALADKMRSPGGLVAAVAMLKQHLHNSGLTATQAAQLISHAFGGGRSSSAIMTMINNLGVMEHKQRQINATTGKYGAAVREQRKTAAAQWDLLKSSIDVIMIKVGDALLGPVTKFTHFLSTKGIGAVIGFTRRLGHLIPVTSIERDWHHLMRFLGLEKPPVPAKRKLHFSDLYSLSKPGLPGWLGRSMFAGYSGPAVKLPAPDISTNLGGLSQARTAWSTRLGGLGTGAAAAVSTSIGTALGKVNWGRVLGQAAGKIGAAIIRLLGKIDWKTAGGKAAYAMVPFTVALVNNIGSAVLSEAFHHPLDMAAFLINLIPIGRGAGILEKIFGKLPIIGPFLRILAKLGAKAEEYLGKILDRVFGPVGKRIGAYFGKAARWLLPKGRDVISGLWHGLEDRWPRAAKFLESLYGKTLRPFAKAAGWLVGKGTDIMSGLWRGIEDRFPAIAIWFYDLPGRMIRFFRRARTWLVVAGFDIMLGLYHGIKNAVLNVSHWIRVNVVSPIIKAVKHWFGIKSPSTVMHGIGLQLVAGLIRGLATHDGVAIARKIFGSLPVALEHIVLKGLVAISRLPGRALSALRSLGASALKGLGGLGGSLIGKLGHLLGIGGGGGGGPAVALGKKMAAVLGWTGRQWSALYNLWMGESGWRWNAANPTSGAYGIPQALPASKMAAAGANWRTSPATQIRWGLDYIFSTYGNPVNAYAKWLSRSPHWYGSGFHGWFAQPTLIGVGERGRERVDITPAGQSGAPSFDVRVFIGDQELTGIVRTEIREHDRQLKRRVRAGSGRAV